MSYNYPGPPQGPGMPGPPQGPGGPGGYFPQGQGPPPPQKRRRGCLYAFLGVAGGAVLLVIAIAVIVGVASSNNKTAGPGSSGGAGNPPPAATAALGTKVRDGKFQFTITKVTHASKVGPSLVAKKAQGRFTILYVTVTNIGSEAQTMDDSSQYVFDAKGRKFSADSEADIFINGSKNSVFFNNINPGNTVHGKIVFDLPKRDHAVKAELHDSAFSNGVTVSLTS